YTGSLVLRWQGEIVASTPKLRYFYIMKNIFTENHPIYRTARVVAFSLIALCAGGPIAQATPTLPSGQVQERIQVSGIVQDEQDGFALPGVSIVDGSGRMLGATDEKGAFRLTVDKGTTLSFSMLGYTAVQKNISAEQLKLTITLAPSMNELNDVVVTA